MFITYFKHVDIPFISQQQQWKKITSVSRIWTHLQTLHHPLICLDHCCCWCRCRLVVVYNCHVIVSHDSWKELLDLIVVKLQISFVLSAVLCSVNQKLNSSRRGASHAIDCQTTKRMTTRMMTTSSFCFWMSCNILVINLWLWLLLHLFRQQLFPPLTLLCMAANGILSHLFFLIFEIKKWNLSFFFSRSYWY